MKRVIYAAIIAVLSVALSVVGYKFFLTQKAIEKQNNEQEVKEIEIVVDTEPIKKTENGISKKGVELTTPQTDQKVTTGPEGMSASEYKNFENTIDELIQTTK